MVEFLRTWGTLIIAALALIQPWIIVIYKKFIRKGIIEIYESNGIEIGYNRFGLTIGFSGTFIAINHDQFVKSIELSIVRLKDQSSHCFEWGYLNPPKLKMIGVKEKFAELPSAFMINASQPYHYNIQFIDAAFQKEIKPYLNKLSEDWNNAIKTAINLNLFEDLQLIDKKSEILRTMNDLFDNFRKEAPAFMEAYKMLERGLFWHAGEYLVEMSIYTSPSVKRYFKKWNFYISQNDFELLRLNVVKILFDICGQQFGDYNFTNVDYKEINT